MIHGSEVSATSTSRPGLRVRVPQFGGVWVFLADALCWTLAVIVGLILRHEFMLHLVAWYSAGVLASLLTLAHLVWGWVLRLFQLRYANGSFDEVQAVGITALCAASSVAIPTLILRNRAEALGSSVLIALPMAVLLMLATRHATRVVRERRLRPDDSSRPTILYGAGSVAQRLVPALLTNRQLECRPVALLDDDPGKRHTRIRGVDVCGTFDALAQVASETGAKTLVVSIAAADSRLLGRVAEAAGALGLELKAVPSLAEILTGAAEAVDLRSVSVEDLIGRRPIDTGVESISGYLTGKRVLVTGAGGSIGKELCRQIYRLNPAELVLLDRDETGLQSAQLSLAGHGLLDTPDLVLADIRDAEALNRILRERRPQVVFHAAALKHLPMLQQYPDEAWKTNVVGTLNVLEAARAVNVDTFVNVSTDKAANPTSVLGHAKRLSERLTAWMSVQTGRRYLSVRFGNVIGSRGSMLPLFTTMIEQGGPLTITDPEATRYFMTIAEACELVLQASAIGESGEVLVLDMGEPVRILDIANRMIELSGKQVEIVFTGLRKGEKLHEVLVTEEEQRGTVVHPKISRVAVPPISPDELDGKAWEATAATLGPMATRA